MERAWAACSAFENIGVPGLTIFVGVVAIVRVLTLGVCVDGFAAVSAFKFSLKS